MTEALYKQKRSLELRWQLEYEQQGKYTLDMVEIDEKIKSIITQIKLKSSKLLIEKTKSVIQLPKFLWQLR